MNNQTPAKSSLLPVWLWFWLGVYIITLPKLISYMIYLFQDLIAQYYTWLVEIGGENSFFEFLRVINLYEIAAYIVVLIGVVSIFFPRVRGKIIEKKYKLAARDENPAIQEITAFTQQYVPHIQVKVNLLRTDLSAITYPLGFRKPALGVFGKLIMLWRSDRKAAEAILLHEIAHIRQGDFLVLGAGSLFETTASYWVWIFLLLVFIPVLLYTGGSILDIGPYLNQIGTFTPLRYLSYVIQLLTNGILSLISEFLSTFSVFILPIAGIWSSELLADRLAASEVKSKDPMQKAMALLAEEKDWKLKEKISAGATHPPTRLRYFLSGRPQSRRGTFLLITFFPLMYFVRLLVKLGTLLPFLLGQDNFIDYVSLAMNTWAESILPIFIAMVVWLLLWNWVEPWWEKFFIHSKTRRDRSYLGTLALSTVVPVAGALCAGILTQLPAPYENDLIQPTAVSTQASAVSTQASADQPVIPTPIPTVLGNYYKIGQVFQSGDAQVIVLGWETLTNTPELQDSPNKKIIRVEIAVRNNGKETIAPLISCARLKDASGNEYHYSINDSENTIVIDYDLPSGAPRPGEKIQGMISFLVDRNSEDFQFIYIANPPQNMSRAYIALTNNPSDRISPPETLPGSSTPSDISSNKTVTLKDFAVTVTKVWLIESETFTPSSGNKLIALDLIIKNTGGKTFKISNIFILELKDENGITYPPSPIITAATGNDPPEEDLEPGKQVSLTIGFELPEKLNKARLQYFFDKSATIELEIP